MPISRRNPDPNARRSWGSNEEDEQTQYYNPFSQVGKKEENTETRVIEAFNRYLSGAGNTNGASTEGYVPRVVSTSTPTNVETVPQYSYNLTQPEVPKSRQQLWDQVISRRSASGAALPSQGFGGKYGV